MGVENLGIADAAKRRREQYGHFAYKAPVILGDAKKPPPAPRKVSGRLRDPVAFWSTPLGINVLIRARASLRLMETPMVARPEPVTAHSVEDIINAVAKVSDLTTDDLKGPRRAYSLAHPRHVAILLVSQLRPDLSLPKIAKYFGNRDHTTVMHARRKAPLRIADEASPSCRWYQAARAELGLPA